MLDGKRIAIIIEDRFEDLELIEPMRAMKAANARVMIIGAYSKQDYRSRSGKRVIMAEMSADKAKAEDFDAIIVAGGDAPYKVELYQSTVELVKQAHSLGRIVAAICYGPQLLISADIVRGHRMTSWPSIAADLRNAGADWVNESVVQDRNIITSRKPADLPMFNKVIIDAVSANSQLPGDTVSFH
jgi:protease I